jgi:hypothetical protein
VAQAEEQAAEAAALASAALAEEKIQGLPHVSFLRKRYAVPL